MALIDDFKTRFPEFDSAAVDTAWPALESLWPCLYGGQYGQGEACTDQAILLLIAHLFYIEDSGEQGPTLTAVSQSVGSVSVTNALSAATSDYRSFYGATKYGQQFLIITSKRQGAVFV